MPSLVSVCLPLHVRVHRTQCAVEMNQSNDPLTDGIDVPGDIVFICRVPTVLPISILSVGVVLKSNHSENVEKTIAGSGGRKYIALVCLTLNTMPFVLSVLLTQYCSGEE